MFSYAVKDYLEMRTALNALNEYLLTFTNKEDVLFNCRLIACELLTNRLKHSKCSATLTANKRSDENSVLICVKGDDDFNVCTLAQLPSTNDTSGRGLYIVKSLCCDMQSEGSTTKVCVEL